MTTCSVCGESCEIRGDRSSLYCTCTRCGKFLLDLDARNRVEKLSLQQQAMLSHRLRLAYDTKGKEVTISQSDFPNWQLKEMLPTPPEQLDRLIILIGDKQPSPAESAAIPAAQASARIGAEIVRDSPGAALGWLLDQPETRTLITQRGGPATQSLSLRFTMAGWQRYEALKHAEITSRTPFMAMQFNDTELNRMIDTCFRPAVENAGFTLRILTHGQPAGIIDDQTRVALRTSGFVIADLTHDNRGAYWEAGFAEGLGRPVIYTYRKDKWEEQKSHFDTNHLVTIPWDPANLDQARKNLTATIRATLPSEAKLTND